MSTNRLGVVVGAGAQGRVVAAIWRRMEPDRELVFLDDNPALWGATVAGADVRGGLQELARLAPEPASILVAIGHNDTRLALAERVGDLRRFATVIDPSAVILPGARLGAGVLVGPQAVVHTAAQVGDHAVINTAAVVEHDCVIGEGAYLAPAVRMAGRVHVGRCAFVATGVTLVGRVRVGDGAIVGAGAVVTSDVPPGSLAYGVPARVVRPAGPGDWQRLF